jgi:hypothetical protein
MEGRACKVFAVAQMKMPSLDDSATTTTIGTMMVLSLLAADFTRS